jgi:hypothetical protein
MKAAPFTCSSEAETRLLSWLDRKTDDDPAIVVSMGLQERDRHGKLTVREDGIHFTLGAYPKGQRPEGSFFEYKGRRVSVMPETLEHLEGKRLVLAKPTWRKLFSKRKILKAEPSAWPGLAKRSLAIRHVRYEESSCIQNHPDVSLL